MTSSTAATRSDLSRMRAPLRRFAVEVIVRRPSDPPFAVNTCFSYGICRSDIYRSLEAQPLAGVEVYLKILCHASGVGSGVSSRQGAGWGHRTVVYKAGDSAYRTDKQLCASGASINLVAGGTSDRRPVDGDGIGVGAGRHQLRGFGRS